MVNIFTNLQRIGKSLMLPISVLPIAGILLGLGAAQFDWLPIVVSGILEQAGGSVFGQMALLFAIGVSLGLTKNNGVACLSAVIGYGIVLSVLDVMASVVGVEKIDTGIFAGVVTGCMAAWSFNRFYRLPTYLMFSGKQAVPIITGLCSIVFAVVLGFVWPQLGRLIAGLASWTVQQRPELAFGIYGVVERSLIPFGLHHIWNVPFFFEAGSCQTVSGETLTGILNCYQAADMPSRTNEVGYFGQLAGGYVFKMFGLPAAAIAIWHTARPEKRKLVGGLMLSAGITSFITGITEPIEFAFLFVAPVLYLVHVLLAGFAYVLTNTLDIVHGTSFSHGLIDFMTLSTYSQNSLLLVGLGLIYAVIYYALFHFLIIKFNLMTPGREKNHKHKKNHKNSKANQSSSNAKNSNNSNNKASNRSQKQKNAKKDAHTKKHLTQKDTNLKDSNLKDSTKLKDSTTSPIVSKQSSLQDIKASDKVNSAEGNIGSEDNISEDNIDSEDNIGAEDSINIGAEDKVNKVNLTESVSQNTDIEADGKQVSLQKHIIDTKNTNKTPVNARRQAVNPSRANNQAKAKLKAQATTNARPQNKSKIIINDWQMPIRGDFVALADIPNEDFSSGVMGAGFGINPIIEGSQGILHAPTTGEVSAIFPTEDAVCIETDTGEELIVYAGIDTMLLAGEGFKALVSLGDQVKAGTPIISIDWELVSQKSSSMIVPVIFSSLDDEQEITIKNGKPSLTR